MLEGNWALFRGKEREGKSKGKIAMFAFFFRLTYYFRW